MIVNIDQRSNAWHEWRKGKIGSSEIASIMGKNPYKTKFQLFQDKITNKETKSNQHIRRGIEQESIALELYCMMYNEGYNDFKPMCFQDDTYDFMIASVDGFNPLTGSLVEIKCPSAKVFHATTEVPPMYYAQIQWQLMISGALKADLFLYLEGYTKIFTVYPNRLYFEDLHQAAYDFKKCLDDNISPEPNANDRVNIDDTNLLDLASKYQKIHHEMAVLQAEIEQISMELKEKTENYPMIEIDNLLITRYEKKGSIDYKSIPALQDLDLEPYRKPSSIQTKITVKS